MSGFLKDEFTSSPVEKNMPKKRVSSRGMKEHGKLPWAKRCSFLGESKASVKSREAASAIRTLFVRQLSKHRWLLKEKEWGHHYKECSLVWSCTFYSFSLPGDKCILQTPSGKISHRNNLWILSGSLSEWSKAILHHSPVSHKGHTSFLCLKYLPAH